jgi:competence protein ComEA
MSSEPRCVAAGYVFCYHGPMSESDSSRHDSSNEAVRELTHTQKVILVAALSLVGVGVLVRLQMAGYLFPSRAEKARAREISFNYAPPVEIAVQVKGAVRNPGVVHLPRGAHRFDAVRAAGGFIHGADSEAMNYAAPLNDGEELFVPGTGDASGADTENQATVETGDGARTTSGGMHGRRADSSVKMKSGVLNINSATVAQLMRLPGVGEKIAARILKMRSSRGPFRKPEELMLVNGIGEKKFLKMKKFISVR